MPAKIVVPELGESVLEATVGRWLKKEGDQVSAGEVLVSLETDKVDLEVGAERSGVLTKIERREGEDVKIGDVLGILGEPSADGTTPEAGSKKTAEAEPAPTPAPSAPPEARPSEAITATAPSAPPGARGPEPAATPSARRIAQEHGIDLSQVPPADGARITGQDVLAYVDRAGTSAQKSAGVSAQPAPSTASEEKPPATPSAKPALAPAAPVPAPKAPTLRAAPVPAPKPASEPAKAEAVSSDRLEERVRMSRRRQTIARRLVEAQHASAMLTTFNEVDMSAVMDMRQRYKESFNKRHGVGLGISSFFVKACVAALQQFPRINAEIDGDEIILKHYYDIGIAVGAPDGLVVPVLRDTDRLSFADIEKGIKKFAQQARDRTLSLEDLRGGTFTISNGGVFGSLMSTPILNPPQVAILGLHKVQERPVSLSGQIVTRPMMYVALSYDHRIVDGMEAVQFLVRVKLLVEDPASLLLEA